MTTTATAQDVQTIARDDGVDVSVRTRIASKIQYLFTARERKHGKAKTHKVGSKDEPKQESTDKWTKALGEIPDGHPSLADKVVREIDAAFDAEKKEDGATDVKDPVTEVPDGSDKVADKTLHEIEKALSEADQAEEAKAYATVKAHVHQKKAPGVGWDRAVGHPELADRAEKEIAEALDKAKLD